MGVLIVYLLKKCWSYCIWHWCFVSKVSMSVLFWLVWSLPSSTWKPFVSSVYFTLVVFSFTRFSLSWDFFLSESLVWWIAPPNKICFRNLVLPSNFLYLLFFVMALLLLLLNKKCRIPQCLFLPILLYFHYLYNKLHSAVHFSFI